MNKKWFQEFEQDHDFSNVTRCNKGHKVQKRNKKKKKKDLNINLLMPNEKKMHYG